MFELRSFIRKLFGVSIEGVDPVSGSDAYIDQLEAHLDSLESENASLQSELAFSGVRELIGRIRFELLEESAYEAIYALMTGLGVDSVATANEDEEDEQEVIEGVDSEDLSDVL